MENVFSSGRGTEDSAPLILWVCRELKYNCSADGLCSVVEDEEKKKKDTRTLERFDKSEDWLAVYWGG